MAPDITPTKLVLYRELAQVAETSVKEVMLKLCDMIGHFRKTPESKLPGLPVQFMNAGTKVAMAVPLEQDEIIRIWDYVPYQDEIDVYGTRFDKLPLGDLRDAAFHLLWFATELTKDREPMTREKVFTQEELTEIDADQLARTGTAPVTLR